MHDEVVKEEKEECGEHWLKKDDIFEMQLSSIGQENADNTLTHSAAQTQQCVDVHTLCRNPRNPFVIKK